MLRAARPAADARADAAAGHDLGGGVAGTFQVRGTARTPAEAVGPDPDDGGRPGEQLAG
ncbi:hypothetical protein [Streptomyces sp. NPDC054804]